MRAPIPKEPSPLALAIRANRERCVAESLAQHTAADSDLATFMAIERIPPEIEAEMIAAGRHDMTPKFTFLDGIPAADWLECREIERQMG